MKNAHKTLITLSLITLLGGCQSITPMLNTSAEDSWQLNGKIAIAYPDTRCNTDNCLSRSDQGKIEWQQKIDTYAIQLSDPFGRVLIHLNGNDERLRAESPGRAAIHAEPQQFISLMVSESEQQTALEALTPKLLRYWVTGRPAPHLPVKQTGNQQFEQQGFRISSGQWRNTTIGQMPSLITITKGEVRLRLVVRDWLKSQG